MWNLWRKATTYHKLPSELFDPGLDALTAWMFDNALTTFGTIVENALQERVEVGEGEQRQRFPRYRLAQLLDPNFKLTIPEQEGFGVQADLSKFDTDGGMAMVKRSLAADGYYDEV